MLFIAISGLFILGSVIGTPTLQLFVSSVSAGGAVASGFAAISLWRVNVQNRKTVLIDRVLGPAYAETRRNREILESWKSLGVDTAVSAPFLTNVASEWRYYTLDENFRDRLEDFQKLIPTIEQQKMVARGDAGKILTEAAKETFQVPSVNTVYLWSSHSWEDNSTGGESGRMPSWELAVDADPLRAPVGFSVHLLQVIDTDSKTVKLLPLTSKALLPLNRDEFQKFWESARKKASETSSITNFRLAREQILGQATDLEHELDSQIKRSQ